MKYCPKKKKKEHNVGIGRWISVVCYMKKASYRDYESMISFLVLK